MGHGGKRANAGRPAGAVTVRSRKVADEAAASGLTPLEYMLRLIRDEGHEQSVRLDAAKAAAPYIHPRLAAVEHTGSGGGPLQHAVTVKFVKPGGVG